MSILKWQVKSITNFALFFIVITHNSPLSFKLINFLLCIKGSNESPNFENFVCSGENLPNSSCHFPNHKSVFLKFCMTLNVMKYNCAVLGQMLYTLHKRDQSKRKFLDFLVPKSTFTKFLSFLKQKISFSSNFAQLFHIMRHIPSILFLDETLYAFSKSSLSQYKLGEISTDQSKL